MCCPSRRKAALLLVSCAIALGLVFQVTESAADWPMFRRNREHAGQTQHDGAENGYSAWEYTIHRPPGWPQSEPLIWASPVVADTLVYAATRHGFIYCFGIQGGDSLWAVQVSDAIACTPAVSDGRLYVMGGRGDRRMHCIDASDGDSIWASMELSPSQNDWNTDDVTAGRQWVDSSPVVVGDSAVYVGARNGTLYRFDAADGDTIWTVRLGKAIWSSPAYLDDKVYVGTYGIHDSLAYSRSGVYCVDEDDGRILWKYSYDDGNCCGTMGSPVIDGVYVYVGVNRHTGTSNVGGAVVELDTMDIVYRTAPPNIYLYPRWIVDIECDVRGTPVLMDGRIADERWLYVSSGRGLYAIATETDSIPRYRLGTSSAIGVRPGGTQMEYWSSPASSARNTIAERETLFFAGSGGQGGGFAIYGLGTDLATLWRSDSIGTSSCRGSWSSPAVVSGRVITCDNNGTVYCYVDDPNGGGRLISPAPSLRRETQRTPIMGAVAGQSGIATQPRALPNPFSDCTIIHFSIPGAEARTVELAIYDVLGRKLRSLISGEMMTGPHAVTWDGRTVNGTKVVQGVYYYVLRVGDRETPHQMLVVR